MTVLDASVVVAALIETSARGVFAESVIAQGGLHAPHLLPAECANILRRAELRGDLSVELAALARADLAALPVVLHPFAPFAERVHELRGAVTAYDGWYVALAEALGTPLATCDLRLTRAPGPTCVMLTP